MWELHPHFYVLGVRYKANINYNPDDVNTIIDAGIYCGYKDGIGVVGLIVFSYASFRVQFEIRQTIGMRYRISMTSGSTWETNWVEYPIS